MSTELANGYFLDLLDGAEFPVIPFDPDSEDWDLPAGTLAALNQPVVRYTNNDLTTKQVNGTGTFDWVMGGVKAHLREEYESGRITGPDYTKAYIALTQAALSAGVQFLVQRDQAYWASVAGQISAMNAKVALITAKYGVGTAQAQSLLTQAQYTNAKLNLNNIIAQESMIQNQILLVGEQRQVQFAQTSDYRTDATAVAGLIGKQKLLIEQQMESYQRDSETKAAKIFSDAWTVQKTVDEGLIPPDAFTNSAINIAMNNILANNGLD